MPSIRLNTLVLISSLVVTANTSAGTEHGHPESLLSLSLEDLMEVEIYTASQKMEKAAESPATISVITAEQLKRWGIISLHDAMALLPGITKNETHLGQVTQTFRGITPGIFNNKSLYLINGHPSYENLFGSTLLDYIPVEMVQRIEVVRSPASVLYGTNAISGVVNIITRQGTHNNDSVTVRSGSHGHRYGSIMHHGDHLSMAASVQRDNGYDYTGTLDEYGNPVDMDYRYDLENLFIDGYGDDWRINVGFFDREKALYGVNPWVWHNGIFETWVGYLDANKKWRLDDGEVNAWLRYDVSDKDIHIGAFPFPADLAECRSLNIPTSPFDPCVQTNPRGLSDTGSTIFNRVERYNLELQLKEQLTPRFSYIVGTSLETQRADPLVFRYDIDGSLNRYAIEESRDARTSALYFQTRYQFDDTLLIAGLRGEDNSDSGGSGLVPRLGITHQIIPGTYAKLLYSEAFRTPMFIEKYVQLQNVLIGDPDLRRETIRTLELGLESQVDARNQLQLALYTIDFEDEILRFPLPPPDPTAEYRNAAGKQMQGLEVEWKSILSDHWEIILNGAYVDGEDRSLGEDDAPFIANRSANAILTYSMNSNWSTTLVTQYVGEKGIVLADTGEHLELDSYRLFNLSTLYRMKQHEFRLILNNLTDEDYSYPETVRRLVADVPGGGGFAVYGQYQYDF